MDVCVVFSSFDIKNSSAVNILDMCPGAHGELSQGNVPRSGRFGSQCMCVFKFIRQMLNCFAKDLC